MLFINPFLLAAGSSSRYKLQFVNKRAHIFQKQRVSPLEIVDAGGFATHEAPHSPPLCSSYKADSFVSWTTGGI